MTTPEIRQAFRSWADKPTTTHTLEEAFAAGHEVGAYSRHQPCMAKAWAEGYDAGDLDSSVQRCLALGYAIPEDQSPELTRNPYVTEDQPVSTVPTPKVQANPDLWR